MTSPLSIGAACAITIGLWLAVRIIRGKSDLPYPPGPRRLPIIGNTLDIDMKEPHLTYTEWGKTYGDIVYSRIFGQDFIIVNSERVGRILADQRSSIYSDRPQSPLYRILGTNRMSGLLPYGNEWKTHRKILHASLRHDVVDRYYDLHIGNACKLLENMRRDSINWREHFDFYASATSLEFTYGRRVDGEDDPLITLASSLAEVMSKETTGERIGLLMALPMLEYLPSWFPGAGFKKAGPRSKDIMKTVAEIPYSIAKKQMESNLLQPSLVADIMTHGDVEESDGKLASAGIFMTFLQTSSTLKVLVLAMVLNPDVQAKVHAELDTVVGKGVLPTFEYKERLPYLQAILYEVLRWRPVVPLGVPHATTASDIYEGYYIPKGCIVIFNAWAMRTSEHSDPEKFDPSRYLTPDGQLKPEAKQSVSKYFGFGRRICPRRLFADNSLWAAAAVMLSALRFAKAKDPSGKDIEVDRTFRPGMVGQPDSFECSITSRFSDE
ncbi:cytochrome P450 [Scleroderma yunnanense]